jgi:hypothetical protein
MNKMFVFVSLAMAFVATSAPAQQQSAQAPVPSWVTPRKFHLDDLVQFGDVYVSKWDDNGAQQSSVPTLKLGGDRLVLQRIVPTLAIDYHERLDLRIVENRPTPEGKIFIILKSGSVLKELKPADLNELELADETRLSREAADKWRQGEPTVESIEVWLDKFGGLQSALPEIPELNEKELSESFTTSKPYEFVFYRTRESLDQDASLTPDGRTMAWKNQRVALSDTARRAAKLRPLLVVRKASTTKKLNGRCLYDVLAAGKWQGYPVAVLVRGSANQNERERWDAFYMAPPEGRTYAEELERGTLRCLGLESFLARTEKVVTVAEHSANNNATIPTQLSAEKKEVASNNKR